MNERMIGGWMMGGLMDKVLMRGQWMNRQRIDGKMMNR